MAVQTHLTLVKGYLGWPLTLTGTLPLAISDSEGYGTRMGLLARPMLINQATGPAVAAVILESCGSTMIAVPADAICDHAPDHQVFAFENIPGWVLGIL